jgi:hypothetical protein
MKFEWYKRLKKTGTNIFRMIQEAAPLQPLEIHTKLQMSVKFRHEIVLWALKMMADELNVIIGKGFVRMSMKIYGRGRCAQSSSHADSRRSRRSNGDPHQAKASSRLVNTILHFSLS